MLKFKDGQTYICTKSTIYWWTEGKEYDVFFDGVTERFAIEDDEGTIWYDNELNHSDQKFKLKEEKQMLKFKEGQTYICTRTEFPWWTEGKEYKVFNDRKYDILVIEDDQGTRWNEKELTTSFNRFELKEEPTMSDLIDNQSHYKNQGIEPIDLMRKNFSKEEFAGFLQGNVLKYMLRYKNKNGVEDLKKAKTYLTWLIKEEEKC